MQNMSKKNSTTTLKIHRYSREYYFVICMSNELPAQYFVTCMHEFEKKTLEGSKEEKQ